MLSLGAMRFDLETQKLGDSKVWYFHPDVPGRQLDYNTLKWWSEQEAGLFRTTLARSMATKVDNIGLTLANFTAWCGENATLWAAPLVFDWSILSSYLNQYRIVSNNVSRRRIIDCRSYMLGKGKDFKRVSFEGMVAHSPVDDCKSQILGLFA